MTTPPAWTQVPRAVVPGLYTTHPSSSHQQKIPNHHQFDSPILPPYDLIHSAQALTNEFDVVGKSSFVVYREPVHQPTSSRLSSRHSRNTRPRFVLRGRLNYMHATRERTPFPQCNITNEKSTKCAFCVACMHMYLAIPNRRAHRTVTLCTTEKFPKSSIRVFIIIPTDLWSRGTLVIRPPSPVEH